MKNKIVESTKNMVAVAAKKVEYDRCYTKMENIGSAVFGCCYGLSNDDGFLNKKCKSCKYLSSRMMIKKALASRKKHALL